MITVDAYNKVTFSSSSSPSCNITIPEDTTLLVVFINLGNNRTTSVSAGGTSMTKIREDILSGGTTVAAFYLSNPSSGLMTVTASFNSADRGGMTVIAIKGTEVSGVINQDNSGYVNPGTSLNISLATTTPKTLLLGSFLVNGSDGDESSGATLIHNTVISPYNDLHIIADYKYVTSSGSNSIGVTADSSVYINGIAIAVKEKELITFIPRTMWFN